MRARGSAGYSAPPLAASISLRFACSRPTPSKGPDAGQRFTVPRDSAVRRRPSPALREEWGESRAAGPGALASWRGRASGLPAPRQLSREDAAARAPPRGGIKPAPLCPPPLPASWSETRGTRGGPGAFRGSGCQAASRRSKELTPFGAAACLPRLSLPANSRPCPRATYTVRRRGAGSALPESGAGSRGEGALSFLGPHTAVTHPEEENK